jgi:hypothetical protein
MDHTNRQGHRPVFEISKLSSPSLPPPTPLLFPFPPFPISPNPNVAWRGPGTAFSTSLPLFASNPSPGESVQAVPDALATLLSNLLTCSGFLELVRLNSSFAPNWPSRR